MISFDFTKEQRIMQTRVRDFCRKEIFPIVRKIEDGGRIPDEVIQGLSSLGLLAMTVSEQYGGLEADPVTVGLIAEEIAKADISCAIPTFFLVEAAWGSVFERYGTKQAKEEILPGVTGGKAYLGIAVTEPDSGSDIAAMKTKAVKKENEYLVIGEKMYVSGIREVTDQFPQGGGLLTVVKTDAGKGTRGMSMLYVPVKEGKGMKTTLLDDWGRKGISCGGFLIENVTLPDRYLIGEENRGFYIAMEGFDYARGLISLVCCAAAMSALEKAIEYLKMRKAFGKFLGEFEGIRFRLAEHWSRLDAIRMLAYRALWMYDKERKERKFNRLDVTRVCAEAKMLAPPAAFEAINDAIQWFGAFGYTTECPLEMALKGVRSYFWAEGTMEIMKIIVSRELLGKEFIT